VGYPFDLALRTAMTERRAAAYFSRQFWLFGAAPQRDARRVAYA
jgi:hypothetical protein